jgi:RimJ/RimL family protein N-acetyltransferase
MGCPAGFGTVRTVELMTGRLVLRRPVDADAADVLALMRDPEAARCIPAPAVADLETARAWCARGADRSDGLHATWDHDHATAKIGYRVGPWHRRRGTATDIVTAVTRRCFAELGLARIQLEHAAGNLGSCAVTVRAGFTLQGILRTTIPCRDAWLGDVES